MSNQKKEWRGRGDSLTNYITDGFGSHPVFNTGKGFWVSAWEDMRYIFGTRKTKEKIQKIWDDDWAFIQKRFDDNTNKKEYEIYRFILQKEFEQALETKNHEQN